MTIGCVVLQNTKKTHETTQSTMKALSYQVLFPIWLVALVVVVSEKVVLEHHNERVAQVQVGEDATMMDVVVVSQSKEEEDEQVGACARALQLLSDSARVSFAIHHNGNPQHCGVVVTSSSSPPVSQTTTSALQQKQAIVMGMKDNNCDGLLVNDSDKYQVEAFLTSFFSHQLMASSNDCSSPDDKDATTPDGLLGYCDMGPERTVIQRDHQNLVRVPWGEEEESFLPCRFYTREGLRITSLSQIQDMALAATTKLEETSSADNTPVVLDLYAVPAGRMFMFAPSHVGELFQLQHVQDSKGRSLVLHTLSLEPRVFDIDNFFSHQESNRLVHKALGETSETHKFHRSTTGTSGASIYNKRTSENAWDTHGEVSRLIKKRCFALLGIDSYSDEMADGLQILRYNLTTAYVPHMDYLEDRGGTEVYDYDSAGKGGNRFATILLYFTDLPDDGAGGETVFPNAWPHDLPEQDRVPLNEAIRQLRESGDASMLKKGSWEEEMAAQCRTRLAIKPNATRAVLFYSQYPNGTKDSHALHGGCPVLKGTKIAANLWTWSGIRPEYDGAPLKKEATQEQIDAKKPKQIKAVFRNSGTDDRFDEHTKVYYDEDGFFGNLGPNDDPVRVNTYKGHVWNIKVSGEKLQTFVIGEDTGSEQVFVV